MVLAPHAKPHHKPTASKKRHGQHHKTTKRYHKTYWPYLPLLLIIVLGFVGNLTFDAARGVLGYATNVSNTNLLQETNIERTEAGEQALSLNGKLADAAQAKAEDMAQRNYWSHLTPEGTQPWAFAEQAGYHYVALGENLAYGFASSDETVTAWMNSPTHRANLLNHMYQEVGFGIASTPDYQGAGPQTVIVAMYGTPEIVVGSNASVAVTPTQGAPSATKAVATEPTSHGQPLPVRHVARVQLLTDGLAPWSLFALSAIAALSAVIFFLRHGLLWRRVLVRGEEFAIRHHGLDILLVTAGVVGFVLTRSAGVIH